MPVNLNISDTLAKRLIEEWDKDIVEKERNIEALKNEVTEIRSLMLELKRSLTIQQPSIYFERQIDLALPTDYHKEWSFFRKIVFLIKKHQRPLSTREIVEEMINKYEPDLKQERSKVVSSVSGVLSAKAKSGDLLKSINEIGENAYDIKR